MILFLTDTPDQNQDDAQLHNVRVTLAQTSNLWGVFMLVVRSSRLWRAAQLVITPAIGIQMVI